MNFATSEKLLKWIKPINTEPIELNNDVIIFLYTCFKAEIEFVFLIDEFYNMKRSILYKALYKCDLIWFSLIISCLWLPNESNLVHECLSVSAF